MTRKPLAVLICAEIAVGAALVTVAWRVIAGVEHPRRAPVAAAQRGTPTGAAPAPGSGPATGSAPFLPALPAAGSRPSRAHLATDRGFMRGQLSGINREQSAWAKAEWGIIDAVLGAARRYIEGVVVPAVERSERPRAGPAGVGAPGGSAGPSVRTIE
ncbi:MAG: hypothetical protein ACREPA_09010 [Candidatus Dormibacteraceae bacterium]